MPKKKNSHQANGESVAGSPRQPKIVILPSNVAVVTPPAEELAPLLPYQRFFLEPDEAAADLVGQAPIHPPGLSPCTAFPAGLVPRFQEALTAGGHPVTVEDRRRFEKDFAVNRNLLRDANLDIRKLARAARVQSLGQVEWDAWEDLTWRLATLCCLYPKARTLIVVDARFTSFLLVHELERLLGTSVGVLGEARGPKTPRCQVVDRSWLPRLRPGRWPVLCVVPFDSKDLKQPIYRALLALRARRVYTLLSNGTSTHLGKATRLRLEALSGQMIGPLTSGSGEASQKRLSTKAGS